MNDYSDGSSQRGLLIAIGGATSRKTWTTSRRLIPSVLAAFRSFFDARKGPTEPFYFYDFYDSAFTYDATGAQTLGRYTVRFAGTWEQMVGIGRADVGVSLVELA